MKIDKEYIQSRVTISESGCWIWNLSTNGHGYAQVRCDGTMQYVHRLTYALWKGCITEGFELDHLCRVRNCCNPDHLEAVSRAVNVQRGSLTKLTDLQVAEIRTKYSTGNISQRALARMYQISQSQIGNIVRCTQWKEPQ